MRCLYCGKELALLKRLTGGGEFCSEAHKQSYQEEYNRLALSRLLQAQAKTSEGKSTPKPGPGRKAPVAVEEPVEAPEVQPVAENPPDAAGFFMSRPAVASPAEASLYLEQWLDMSAAPANPQWEFSPAVHVPMALEGHDDFATLPEGELLRFEAKPVPKSQVEVIAGTNVSPEEFQPPRPDLRLPVAKPIRDIPSAAMIILEVRPRALDSDNGTTITGTVRFQTEVLFRKSELLQRSQAQIELPAEDADVVVAVMAEPEPGPVAPAIVEEAAAAETAAEEPDAEPEEASPREALKALSKLHQDLKQEQEAEPAASSPEPVAPISTNIELAATSEVQDHAAPAQPEAKTPAPAIDGLSSQQGIGDFVEVPLKTFAPGKAVLMLDTNALLTLGQPILPTLKGLPLRPKMAMAPPGFAAKTASTRSSVTEAKLKSATIAPRPRAEEKSNPPSQPAVVEQKPAPAPAAAKTEKAAAKPSDPPQIPRKAPSPASGSIKQPPQPPATPTPPPKPANREVPRTPPPRKEETTTKPAAPASGPEPSLTFETLQLQLMENSKTPFWGSLKVKLIIAIILVLGLAIGYYSFGSKNHKPAATPSASADGVGPSIMVGEGGWVQGWAGDVAGAHVGRQITIYRPSLKLADYRIEFQGQIENKSLGWVFRAADGDNYYAMKLAFVSTALPLKAALIKFMIYNGKETELGRIPLDVPVNDTMFNVRMDVRGPRFNTYIQGQQVDVWTNDQLKTGGVGFLNERSERGKIKSVSISVLTGGEK